MQQIRDNLRLSNWASFPGNSIQYSYTSDFGEISLITYLRDSKPQFSIEKTYNEWGKLIEEKYKSHTDGTDNL